MTRSHTAARGNAELGSPGSTLGKGVQIRGRVSGDGDLRVEGQLEGDLTLSGEVEVHEGGAVTGDVDADAVVIAGGVTGDVISRGALTLRAGARVDGNLTASEICVEEGASFSGRIDMDFEMPAELTPRHGR